MEIAAYVFAAAVALGVGFQLALAAGAPWGELAMGGRFPGRLPPAMRVAAAIQAVVLGSLAFVVADRAGVVMAGGWGRLVWVVVGISILSLAMNLASRSSAERALWSPVAAVMVASSAIVALA